MYREIPKKTVPEEKLLQFVVPQSMREELLNKAHQFGHWGLEKAHHLLSQRFYWPKMKADLRDFTYACIPCGNTKPAARKRTPLTPVLTTESLLIYLENY